MIAFLIFDITVVTIERSKKKIEFFLNMSQNYGKCVTCGVAATT